MTVHTIKKRIYDEVNSPHDISKYKMSKLKNKVNLNKTKLFSHIWICRKHDIYAYFRQYKWLRKLYRYIRRTV